MAVLHDQQFEIDGVTFGGPFDSVKLDRWDVGSAGLDVQDQPNPFGSNMYMGRDIVRAPEWAFEMVTDGGVSGGIHEARDAAEALAIAWRNPYRHEEQRAQTLRYSVGGQTRLVYGRGRKFDMDVTPLAFSGTAPIQATFQLSENIYYSDSQETISLPIVPEMSGGLTAPLKAPLVASGDTQFAERSAFIGGTVPTPVMVQFHGPIQAPWVRGNGFFVKYDYALAADQVLTITSHHKLMVRDNFGRNLLSKMSIDTRFSNVRIPPGQHYFTFGGSDLTGTAKASVSWRNAYTML